MEKEKERHIIEQVLAGRQEAYRELVDAYSAQVFTFIKGIVGSYEDAQDIAQEVFIKSFFSLQKYRGDCSFFSWLYRVAYNEAISFLRKKKRKGNISFIENVEYGNALAAQILDEDGVARKIAEEKRYKDLQAALERLEADEQFLIVQFYYKKASIKELCEITGLTESNVKVKLFRTKKKLSNLLSR